MAVDGSDTDSSKSSAADALQASMMRVLEELKLGQKSQAADAGMLKDEFARVALSCKHSAETAQAGILALTALQESQAASFSCALRAFEEAGEVQKVTNRKVDEAIAQLNRNVEAMQKQIVSMQKAARIGAPAAAAGDPSSEDNLERPLKASRLFQGKGTAARRAYSAEPQAHAPHENCESAFEHNIQGGDARKCHIVLKDPVISSRLRRGVRELLEATMPALSATG
jgi:hypothetical protein